MDKLFFLSPDKETNKNIINQLKKDQKYKNIIDTIILILNKKTHNILLNKDFVRFCVIA